MDRCRGAGHQHSNVGKRNVFDVDRGNVAAIIDLDEEGSAVGSQEVYDRALHGGLTQLCVARTVVFLTGELNLSACPSIGKTLINQENFFAPDGLFDCLASNV